MSEEGACSVVQRPASNTQNRVAIEKGWTSLKGCTMAEMGAECCIKAFGRKLVHIPIVHTETDLGGLSRSVQREGLRILGSRAWRSKLKAIDARWAEIEGLIEHWELCYERVRLYQDGLPVCGRELEIVADLAKKGSLNHRLVQRLIEKGASLMGTESAELLLEEYERAKVAARSTIAGHSWGAKGPRPSSRGPTSLSADLLLSKRDDFIAARINSTLREGETGILFLGMLHSLDNLLAEDIEVVYVPRLPSNRKGKRENERIRSESPHSR